MKSIFLNLCIGLFITLVQNTITFSQNSNCLNFFSPNGDKLTVNKSKSYLFENLRSIYLEYLERPYTGISVSHFENGFCILDSMEILNGVIDGYVKSYYRNSQSICTLGTLEYYSQTFKCKMRISLNSGSHTWKSAYFLIRADNFNYCFIELKKNNNKYKLKVENFYCSKRVSRKIYRFKQIENVQSKLYSLLPIILKTKCEEIGIFVPSLKIPAFQ